MPDITSPDRVNLVRNTQMVKEAALALALRDRQLQAAEQQAMGQGQPPMGPGQMMPSQASSAGGASSLGMPAAQDPRAGRMNQLAQMLRARQMGQAQSPIQPPAADGSALLGN